MRTVREETRKLVEFAHRRIAMLRARTYKRAFYEGDAVSIDGERVLADLREFARIGRASFPVATDAGGRMDPIKLARFEGRREVVWRILEHINLDEAAIQLFVEVSDDE